MRRRLAAEAIGTFFIVFAPLTASASNATLSIAAAVSGLAVLAMIYAFGPISSAHFNPAVTLGFAVAGRFSWRDVIPYMVSQFGGAILAAGLGALLFGPGHGAHVPSPDLVRNVGTEAVLSFLLMLVIIAVATDKRVHSAVPGFAIGLTVVLCVLMGGPITGGSMNPARSFGPGLFSTEARSALWLYLSVPPIGAALAARFYEWIRTDQLTTVTSTALD